jgi:UDP-N-acetylmuramoylalanine--D-glutamate ligase
MAEERAVHLTDLRNRRVVVWGTGREGAAAVAAIAPIGPADLVAVEDRPTAFARPREWTDAVAAQAPVRTGADAHAAVLAADVVVRSPVIAQTHPWIIEARDRGIRVTGGTSLWMGEHAGRTIGITGSKGKSTTTTLVHQLLTAVGRPNVLGGNIGVAALSLPEADLYVLELSVYQCADLDDSPWVTAVTSLYPEHLDWAGSEENYYRDKLNLVAHRPGRVVINGDDAQVADRVAAFGPGLPLLAVGGPATFHVGPGPDGEPWFRAGSQPLFARARLPLVGRHNEANACIALGILASAGVDCVAERDVLAAAVERFQGLSHRLEPIADPSGITFVDDSISTIPQSAIHAIEAYAHQPLTVLLGGEDRGVDYTPLHDFLAERKITATVIALPDSGARIVAALKDIPTLTMLSADDLLAAVRLAREVTPSGGAVLLSPAAPSYGRYDNFEHRSRVFRQAILDTAPAPAGETGLS